MVDVDAEAQTMALRTLLSRVPLGLLSALNQPMTTAELAAWRDGDRS